MKICCPIVWIPKPLPRSDDNMFAVPGTVIPAVRIVNDASFQQSSDPVKGLEA